MNRLPTIAISVGVALGSILLFLGRTGRLSLPDATSGVGAPDPSVCTSSYFGNQCAAHDTGAILAARGDRAYSGRGYEAPVSFVGVWSTPDPGQSAIVGMRAEGQVVCVTGNAGLARSARFELNYGDRAVLSGVIDRRDGRTVYLTNCAYWRG
ncbi:MAG: hypothetical protein KDJ23_15570 [Rhodoblastus sp.]|nr:hypothetical protein [Rhodoblastus sp.]MCC2101652.1 hypothetical protein [Hyphomicrobiales bacterium]MCC2109489.1 hypothetical protein [Hyphomicrobiales bacterium]MCO5088212.1 hypothetical protein [Methylobacteriaceae bacterium]